MNGRAELEKGLTEMFRSSKLEFVENNIESTLFYGEMAVETCIFKIKITPKNGDKPTFSRGRSMVMYVHDKQSPTGWLSIREMVQAAPDENQ